MDSGSTLASVFSRNADGSLNWGDAPIFSQIAADPELSRVCLIAEPWDTGAYQLGRGFPGVTWLQWNGRFRDDVRRFVKGDPAMVPDLMRRIYGSDDFFPDDRAGAYHAYQTLNYIASHDGFTLYDLVSFNLKRNSANGHENRGGMDDNFSWNCGHEGVENVPPRGAGPATQAGKETSAACSSSQTVLMFRAGDEFLNSQFGNNNPYNQDNGTSWLDWDQFRDNQDIFRFFQKMIAFRKAHASIAQADSGVKMFHSTGPALVLDLSRIHSLAFCLHGASQADDDIYVMINAYWEPVTFGLQEGAPHEWQRVVDTALPSPHDFVEYGVALEDMAYDVALRSIVVLLRSRLSAQGDSHENY